jgi:hypothetical protein
MKPDPQTTNPKVTIDGDKQITSWEDDDSFTMWIEPRMATAKEINDALMEAARKDPSIVVGQFSGVRFIK